MSANDLNHFLVVYRISAGRAEVLPFGTEYAQALDAYNAAEAKHRNDSDIEVVLLGSDSLETLKRTHSSYFDLELSEKHIDRLVVEALSAAGLA